MNRTKIPYAEFTWNPFVGCSRISPGCGDSSGGGCYAERLASTRLRHLPAYAAVTNEHGWNGKVHLMPERLDEPLRRRKPARVFLGDMGDLFHPEVPFQFIAACFGVMAACPQHQFLVLTKRPARMLEFFGHTFGLENVQETVAWEASHHAGVVWDARGPDSWRYINQTSDSVKMRRAWPGWPLPNVHLGTTCEDQQRANERIPLLLRCPAAVRWVSAEPLISGIDFHGLNGISLVIPGGESGPNARPCDVEWIRSIRDQCRAAGTACFVKQMNVGGKMVTDVNLFPSDLQIRESPCK